MKINKSNSIAGSFALFLFGLFLLIFLFGLTLFTRETTSVDMGFLGRATVRLPIFEEAWQNGILSFLLPLPAILCFERGVYDLRRGLRIRRDEIGASKSVWRKFAVYYRYADFFSTIVFIILFLVLAAFTACVLVRADLMFTVNSLFFFIGILVYVLLRKTLKSGLKTASSNLRKGFPSYTLSENAIDMRLYPIGKGKRAVNPPPVRLYFDELDEVRILNDVEADNYMRYTIGPDLGLSRALVSDQYRYLKGEIARPGVFRSGTCTNSKSVLFRGKGLFYLMTFETDDVEIIEAAFVGYRRQKQQM